MFRKIILGSLICLSCCTFRFFSPPAIQPAPETLLQRADEYKKKGRYLEALSFYRDIHANMDTWKTLVCPSLYKGLADIYCDYLGDTEHALALYTKLITTFPDGTHMPSAYHMIAKIYYKKGERETAVKYYTDLLSVFPAFYKDNRIDDEIKSLEKGEQLFKDIALSIERPLPRDIRVLVEESSEPVEVASEGTASVSSLDSSALMKTASGITAMVSPDNNSICFDGNSLHTDAVRINADNVAAVKINGRPYRGYIVIRADQGRLMVINHLPLDEYLYGVLPREVSPSWPEHALKAQAVAARTYALYHMVKREGEPFDLFSTTSSQVYGGRDKESPVTQNAVDTTNGLVVTWDNKIILSLFHANSGGETAKPDDVWDFSLPYLTAVKDTFSENRPGCTWEKTLSADAIRESMKKFGLPVQRLDDIIPVDRASSGRIKTLKIAQGESSFYLSGNSFRLIVGAAQVKSTNFEIKRKKGNFIFKGTGYGHGAGMSQWGAYGMAKSGYDFKQILQFYYPGTTVQKIIN